MPIRKIVALAAVAPLLLGVTAADAAAKKKAPVRKPVCKLVNDPAGDGTGSAGVALPNDPALDVHSADVATNATTLTAVVRLASLAGTDDSSPTGRAYDFVFKARGTSVLVRGVVTPTVTSWAGGAGTGVVDKAKNEIRISVPLAKLAVPIKPNDKLTELTAVTWHWAHTSVAVSRADTATSPAAYVAGWPSCVKVGA